MDIIGFVSWFDAFIAVFPKWLSSYQYQLINTTNPIPNVLCLIYLNLDVI